MDSREQGLICPVPQKPHRDGRGARPKVEAEERFGVKGGWAAGTTKAWREVSRLFFNQQHQEGRRRNILSPGGGALTVPFLVLTSHGADLEMQGGEQGPIYLSRNLPTICTRTSIEAAVDFSLPPSIVCRATNGSHIDRSIDRSSPRRRAGNF